MTHYTQAEIGAIIKEISAALRNSEIGVRKQAVVARKGNNTDALKKCLATAHDNGWGETAAFIESIMP
jgi:hypothetical protein